MTSEDLPHVFFTEVEESWFPIHVSLYDGDKLVWEANIREPGALTIPVLPDADRCLVQFGNGECYDSLAPLGD